MALLTTREVSLLQALVQSVVVVPSVVLAPPIPVGTPLDTLAEEMMT